MVRYLLDRGAEVDKHGVDGTTPSYRASYSRHAKTLELLLQWGADVEGTTTDNGLRPIHVAYDSTEMMRVLLRQGAECGETSPWGTPLILAARHDYPDTVRLLLDDDMDGCCDRCDSDVEEDGETALTIALWRGGREDVLLALLDAGADVNRAMDGVSPLHLVVERGTEALVAKMLQSWTKVDARDSAGNAPLNRIQRDTPVSIARALLSAGAALCRRCSLPALTSSVPMTAASHPCGWRCGPATRPSPGCCWGCRGSGKFARRYHRQRVALGG